MESVIAARPPAGKPRLFGRLLGCLLSAAQIIVILGFISFLAVWLLLFATGYNALAGWRPSATGIALATKAMNSAKDYLPAPVKGVLWPPALPPAHGRGR